MDTANLKELEDEILQHPGVFDPEGVHHEFADGMHGQKINIDAIPKEGSLYAELVNAGIEFIYDHYGPKGLPVALIGTANGANRFAISMALGIPKISGLRSEKYPTDKKKVRLNSIARSMMSTLRSGLVLVIDDIGTKGSMSVQVAHEAELAGAGRVEVMYLMQRRPRLEHLDEADIAYSAIMHRYLDTYSAEECQTNPNGFCARSWELIKHGK